MRRSILEAPRRSDKAENDNRLQCKHYWVIEMARGPRSKGRCKYCGTERDFSNLVDDVRWDSGVFDKSGSGMPQSEDRGRSAFR